MTMNYALLVASTTTFGIVFNSLLTVGRSLACRGTCLDVTSLPTVSRQRHREQNIVVESSVRDRPEHSQCLASLSRMGIMSC